MSNAGYHYNSKERERQWALQHASFAIKRLSKIVGMTPKSHPTLAMIDIVVSHAFGVDVSDLKGKSLWCLDVAARQVAMSLAYTLTPYSLKEIAAHFHRCDHTVILYSHRKYGAELAALCKASGLPIYQRTKGQRTSIVLMRDLSARTRKLANELQALVSWKEAPTTAEDIFPELRTNERLGVLRALHNRGYVTRERGDGALWWQITAAGLNALEQMKEAA